MIANIRRLEAVLGHGRKEPGPAEQDGWVWATKSVVAVHDLAAGAVLGAENLITKRPGSGIPANQLAAVIGRTLAKAVAADTLLQLDGLVDDPA
ncbi:MAG: SAF domain-containing protein [Alphaproteobacteria bacterium]